MEEPLSAFDNDMEISGIFQSVTEKLLEMGKTVIVVSQNDSVLTILSNKVVAKTENPIFSTDFETLPKNLCSCGRTNIRILRVR